MARDITQVAFDFIEGYTLSAPIRIIIEPLIAEIERLRAELKIRRVKQ